MQIEPLPALLQPSLVPNGDGISWLVLRAQTHPVPKLRMFLHESPQLRSFVVWTCAPCRVLSQMMWIKMSQAWYRARNLGDRPVPTLRYGLSKFATAWQSDATRGNDLCWIQPECPLQLLVAVAQPELSVRLGQVSFFLPHGIPTPA